MDDVTRRERTISGALALAMHALFLILLVVGVSWQSQRSAAPIAVELWSELPAPARPAPEPPPPPPEPVKQAPRPEPRPAPKPEFKPIPDPQIAIKEQLAKKKLLEEKVRLERERKEHEQKEKLAKEKTEKEQKLKEAEAKKRKEKELAERKKREEERKLAELKRQEEAKKEQELQAMLQKQQAQQAAEAAARARLDAYSRLVADKIRRFIVEPPNMQGKPEAVFTVVQIPGGDIIDLRLKRSSGNAAYDAAAERAIRRAQPLPPPPDPARFGEVRELELIIRPEGR